MTAQGPKARLFGWLLAGTTAGAFLCGAGALALTGERQAPVLFLDLAERPPSAPAVAAVADSAPQVVDEAPPAPAKPTPPDTAPDTPPAPPSPDKTAPMPEPDLPPQPEKPDAGPEKPATKATPAKPQAIKDKAADTAADTAATARPEKSAQASAAAATAPQSGTMAKGGGSMSPAAYAKAVMKKVRATRKMSGAGKGAVVVGFTIAADGNLTSVQLLQGSGNAALDKVALDHIRRSAPFAPPPDGAGVSYSFEFVGK